MMKHTILKKESSVKLAEPRPSDDQFNLDGILSELGSFGKYQLLLLLLLAFRDSFLSMCNFHYVFTAPEVAYRCQVPECEDLDSSFNASWRSFALLNDSRSCMRPSFHHGQNSSEEWSVAPWNETGFCNAENFDHRRNVPCEKIVYENYNSIVAEFDLGCEPWKRTMIGTVHNLGLVFSLIISGFISDRYGRKVIIVWSPLLVGTAGLVKSFSTNYWMLLVLEFLECALMGYGNTSMVLSLETVSHKQRVIFSCISDILSSFGGAFFGLIAWKIPYWRHMMRVIYAPLLVAVFYIFLVDEGVRWLLAHNKNHEAVRVLNKVAKINNITLSNKSKEMLAKISEDTTKAEQNKKEPEKEESILAVLRSRTILFRVALMAGCFFSAMFVYNSSVIISTTISGNKYLNYSALQLIAIPTRIVTAYTLTKFGRKGPICVAYTLCAIFFVASAFCTHSLWWISIILYLAGKMCSSFGNFAVHVAAMEIFPTTSRNILTNIANMVGRFGSVLAPQTPLLEQYMHNLPTIVFGVMALGPAVLSLALPDTSNVALPDDVSQAEKLDDPEKEKTREEERV